MLLWLIIIIKKLAVGARNFMKNSLEQEEICSIINTLEKERFQRYLKGSCKSRLYVVHFSLQAAKLAEGENRWGIWDAVMSMLAHRLQQCLYVQLNYWSKGSRRGRLWHFAWYFSWELFQFQTFDLYNPEHDCTSADTCTCYRTHTIAQSCPARRPGLRVQAHVVSFNSSWHQQNWVWSQCGRPL